MEPSGEVESGDDMEQQDTTALDDDLLYHLIDFGSAPEAQVTVTSVTYTDVFGTKYEQAYGWLKWTLLNDGTDDYELARLPQ